ncbi:hypothetical protein IV203_022347 [Nitzschia inconspicua]|uniref:DUF6824 domain-containing protein n=1 Tax=Nitzschia inconspicua TaxID=303405 RepID=A0A9K3PGR1_9STRA|nr:hypothetical protein IV203_022347 [Nitzschia inconspicua]
MEKTIKKSSMDLPTEESIEKSSIDQPPQETSSMAPFAPVSEHRAVSDGNDHENDQNAALDNDNHIDEEEEEGSSTASGGEVMQFDPAQGIKEPKSSDILCGRGRSTSDHPANVLFRELVNGNKDAYQKAKRRDEKTKITCDLVDRLRRHGRFVLFDPKTKLWYEVSEEYAREKVSHSLRSRPMEQRRNRPRLKTKVLRVPKHSPALDDVVQHILQDQQSILKAMMQKESNRMAAEAIMRATLGQPSL